VTPSPWGLAAASGAYLLAEERNWARGLDRGAGQAPRFYLAMGFAIAAGAATSLLGLPPIQLLYRASIAGGVATSVGLVLAAMGRFPVSRSNDRPCSWGSKSSGSSGHD
jgi:hypothetical protein